MEDGLIGQHGLRVPGIVGQGATKCVTECAPSLCLLIRELTVRASRLRRNPALLCCQIVPAREKTANGQRGLNLGSVLLPVATGINPEQGIICLRIHVLLKTAWVLD